MIIFLLMIIIAILLFGSSAVIGVVGAVLGFGVLVLALLFGLHVLAVSLHLTIDDIFIPAIVGFTALFFVSYLILWFVVERRKKAGGSRPARKSFMLSGSADASATTPDKKMWDFFSIDIENRFNVEQRARAHEIYKSGSEHELRRYCESVLRQIVAPAPPGWPADRQENKTNS